jgi:WD40 repeat protein
LSQAALSGPTLPQTTHPTSPYKGLLPYSEDDSSFFFGRESERQIITANLQAARLTVLYGASGVGKSSVLLAGVVHQLRDLSKRNLATRGKAGFAVVVFRSWRDDPVSALIQEVDETVTALTGEPADEAPSGRLAEALQAQAERLGGSLLIILDQFEEYFLYHAHKDGPGTFAVEFPDSVNRPELRADFLISIREDALAKLDRFKGRIPNLFSNYLRIDHLDVAAARTAIEGPIDEYNRRAPNGQVEVEPELVTAVLEQVRTGRVGIGPGGAGTVRETEPPAGEARVETAYMQLVLTKLWEEEREERSDVLQLKTLERLGGAESIVRASLDEVMNDLPEEEQEVAARVFHFLVTKAGTKIAHTATDLADFAGLAPEQVEPVLKKLSAGEVFVLRPVAPPPEVGGETRYEIFHDVLAAAILEWRARFMEALTSRESKEQLRRERRKTKIYAGLALLSVLAAIAIGVLAWTTAEARNKAQDQTERARAETARAALAQAQAQLFVDPAKSLALAADVLASRPSPAAEGVLAEALSESHLRVVVRHRKEVGMAAFDPAGDRLLTAGFDGRARVVDAQTGRELAALRNHRKGIAWAAFDAEGERVVTGGRDGVARVSDAATGDEIAAFRGHRQEVSKAAFLPAGRWVVSTGWSEDPGFESTLATWDAATGRRRSLRRAPGFEFFSAFAVSPDGRFVLTGRSDGAVQRWRVLDGRLERPVSLPGAHGDDVNEVAFAPGGRFAVTASEDGTARVWRVAGGRLMATLRAGERGIVSAAFSADGRRLVTASEKAAVVWNARSGKKLAELRGHTDWVNDANFRADGNLVVTAGADGTARVWEARTGTSLVVLRGHTSSVWAADFGRGGEAVVTASADGTARIWDVSTGIELRGHADWVLEAAINRAGDRVLTAAADGDVVLWDAETGENLGRLEEPHDGRDVNSVEFSFDGGLFVTAGADEGAQVRDGETGERKATLEQYWVAEEGVYKGHYGAVRGASFSPDAKRVVTASNDWTARIWSVGSAKELLVLNAGDDPESPRSHDGVVTGAVYASGGELVVTAGADARARVWDAQSGDLLRTFTLHLVPIHSIEASRDGQHVVTVAEDRTARVWDPSTGRQLAVLRGHGGTVANATFSPDGNLVATVGSEGVTRVWEWRSGRLVGSLRKHADYVNSVAFGPSEGLLLTASDDRTAKLYRCEACAAFELPPEERQAELLRLAARADNRGP